MKAPDKNFRPLGKLLFIRREKPETKRGGIFLPPAYTTFGWRATVISRGNDSNGFGPGDDILFLKDATVLPFDDRTLALTESNLVLAKIEVRDFVELIIPQNNYALVEHGKTEDKDGEVVNSYQAPSRSGLVWRSGPGCHNVRAAMQVWWEGDGIDCVEDGHSLKIINESNILCVQSI